MALPDPKTGFIITLQDMIQAEYTLERVNFGKYSNFRIATKIARHYSQHPEKAKDQKGIYLLPHPDKENVLVLYKFDNSSVKPEAQPLPLYSEEFEKATLEANRILDIFSEEIDRRNNRVFPPDVEMTD